MEEPTTFDEILNELEEAQDLTRSQLTRYGARFAKISEQLEEVGRHEEAEKAKWESLILYLDTRNTTERDSEQGRFDALIKYENGQVFPDLEALKADHKALAYYSHRSQATENSLLRARYTDFLWEARVEDRYQFAIMAIDSYLANIELLYDNGKYLEMVDALDRSAELIRETNNAQRAEVLKQECYKLLDRLPVEARLRWIIEIGHTLLNIRKLKQRIIVPDEELRAMLIELEGIAHYWQEKGKYILQQHVLQLAFEIASVSDQSSRIKWQQKIAEAYENEARIKGTGVGPSSGPVVAAHFYELAIQEYLRLLSMNLDEHLVEQIQEKIDELKVLIRSSLKLAEDESTMISVEGEFSVDELSKIVDIILHEDPIKSYSIIASASWLMPDLEALRGGLK